VGPQVSNPELPHLHWNWGFVRRGLLARSPGTVQWLRRSIRGRDSFVAATAAAGSIVGLVVPSLLFIDVGIRGHRLGDQVIDELGVDLENQLADDHVTEMAVGDDLLEGRPVRP